MENMKLGILGGSGIYDIDGVQDGEWISVDTPFGVPSDKIFKGTLHGIDVAFLPRHGRGHVHRIQRIGRDIDAGAGFHRRGDVVAFGFGAAGQRNLGKDIGVHRHLVHGDRADATRAYHQNLAHL